MAEQVAPIGGLAAGLPAALSMPVPPATGNGRSAKGTGVPSGASKVSPEASAQPSPGKAVEQVNDHLQQAGSQLRMQADPGTGRIVYKVVDPSTGQVVLQVPSAEVLAMAHSLQAQDKQMGASGVLLDKKG